jgi:hypothetical protein
MIRRISIGALVAATAALAACGSSGPSKADFIKKADTECQKVNAAHPPTAAPKNAKEASAQQGQEIQIRTDLDKKLKSLKVADAVKDDFDTYKAQTTQIIAQVTKMKADADRNDEKTYTADQAGFSKLSAAREVTAKKIGFRVCGRKIPQASVK